MAGQAERLRALRGLYAIIDLEACAGREALWVAQSVLQGGCALLQLRAKLASDQGIVELGRALGAVCARAGVPFVLNDRADLCAAVGAQGVHLGQADSSIEEARARAGSAFVGLSTHNLEQAREAARRGADLIAFGPVFATSSKRDPDPVVGLDALRLVTSELTQPVVAIGGIDARNALEVAAAGAPLAAVISAVCRAPDPTQAARALHQCWVPSSTTAR